MLHSIGKLCPGNKQDVAEQENKAISAAAARDRETMEGQIQALSAQVRDLQESLSDTATRLDDTDRSLRSSEKRNEERLATIEDLEKRLKAANAKQHELVNELTSVNAQLNKVKDAAYEAAKKKDETISKLQEALEQERMRVDEVFRPRACVLACSNCLLRMVKLHLLTKIGVLRPPARIQPHTYEPTAAKQETVRGRKSKDRIADAGQHSAA